MTRVVCIGECMVEFRSHHDDLYARSFAGDAYNTAVYLKRSAPECSVQFMTVTGDDAVSEDMRQAWQREGIEDALAFRHSGLVPGLYMIQLDSRGERSFIYWRSASPARGWLHYLESHATTAFKDAALIYFSGISLAILPAEQRLAAIELLRAYQRDECRLAFDPNYRAALWESHETAREIIDAAMGCADIVLPSEDDLNALQLTVPAAAESATTLGARGCRLRVHQEEHLLPSSPAVVHDTSGAGDSFNGAYLAARLRGTEPVAAAKIALSLAERVVSAAGAIIPQHISHPVAQDRS